jgi:hypothetical protein
LGYLKIVEKKSEYIALPFSIVITFCVILAHFFYSSSVPLKKGICLTIKTNTLPNYKRLISKLALLNDEIDEHKSLKSSWIKALNLNHKRVSQLKERERIIRELESMKSKPYTFVVLDNFKSKGLYYITHKNMYTTEIPELGNYFIQKCKKSDQEIIKKYSNNKEETLARVKFVSN